MEKNQFELLKQKRFLPLFITQFLGSFNDNVYKNALVVLITFRLSERLHFNEQILVTLAAGLFILPYFLFSATAGQLADKVEKSRLIIFIKIAEVILMILAVLGFYLQNIPIMMLVLFLLGTQATFFGPVKYSILPAQLHPDELLAGNGLIEAGTFIAILLGTIYGGIFILLPSGEYYISLTLIILALAGLASSWFIPNTNISHPSLKINFNFLSETVRVIKYSKSYWDLYLSILGISWFWLVGAVFLAEFPVFAKDILHSNEHVVTWFFSLFSVGIALGSILCNRLLKGKIDATYVPLGAIGMTIFAVDLYFASNQLSKMPVSHQLMSLMQFLHLFTGWRISFDLLLLAICGGLYTVPLYSILQQRSHADHRARVIASNNIINALFMVLAALGTVLLLKINFTVNGVFLTIAILNAFVAIYICKLMPAVILKEILKFALKIVYRVKVKNIEHYYQAGERVIIVANHTSFLDAALLAAFLPDKFTFAVDTNIAKKWWVRFFLRLVDAFPMDPTNPIAIKSLIAHVKQGKKCVIFPEGRITVTGALMKIYEGPGLIADKADAVLLPICISGAQYSPFSRMRGKLPIRFAPEIILHIFPGQKLNIAKEMKGRLRRHTIGLYLYDLMSNVVFESCNYRQSLFKSLLQSASVHGKDFAILEDANFQPVTYQQLVLRSFILALQIKKYTKENEYTGLLLPNMATTVITFFAMQSCARIPAMINYTSGIRNIINSCNAAKIKKIITSKRFIQLAKLTDIIKELQTNGITIFYLEDWVNEMGWQQKLCGKLQSLFPMLAYKEIDSTQAAVVLFTSGSEGKPKGVVLSHQNIQSNRYQLSSRIDFTEKDKIFSPLPIFHSFGLTGGMLLPILSGIPVFLYPSPLHYRVIPQLIYGLNATIVFGTDTFLSNYAKHAHPYDFYSVRYIFSGAEKLRAETLNTWLHKFGIRIFDGYGATETSPVLSTNTPMQYRTGTVGRLLPGIQYKLIPVPGIDTGGLLTVTGPNIMKGYLLSSDPGVITTLTNGWYETGDIVTIDEDGFITIQGRMKRFAKIAGEMISLTMVEQLINQLWPNYQHAVINMPDEKKGEHLILVTTYSNATREELLAYFKSKQVTELSVPKKMVTLAKLPLLGSGKIDYANIKEMLSHTKQNKE